MFSQVSVILFTWGVWQIPPWADTPRQIPTWADSPMGRHPPPLGRHPPPQAETPLPRQTPPPLGRQPPPLVRHPPPLSRHVLPWADTTLGRHLPEMATAADGTYPTGKHSCWSNSSSVAIKWFQNGQYCLYVNMRNQWSKGYTENCILLVLWEIELTSSMKYRCNTLSSSVQQLELTEELPLSTFTFCVT